jgi:hypothetical protein
MKLTRRWHHWEPYMPLFQWNGPLELKTGGEDDRQLTER